MYSLKAAKENIDRPVIVLEAMFSPDGPSRVQGMALFMTKESAQKVLDKFPKSAKLRLTSLSTHDRNDLPRTFPMIMWDVNLRPTGVTGEVNEGGIRRYNSLVRAAAKNNVEIVWGTAPTLNWSEGWGQYLTQEEFEAALDA